MEPIPGGTPGWRMGTRHGLYHVDVITGRDQTRVVLQEMDAPPKTYYAFWCYFGEHRDLVAVAAARAWLVVEDDEPLGYQRSWRTKKQ